MQILQVDKAKWEAKMAKIKCWEEEIKLFLMLLGAVTSAIAFIKQFIPKPLLGLASLGISGMGSGGGGMPHPLSIETIPVPPAPVHVNYIEYASGLAWILFSIFALYYIIRIIRKYKVGH